MPRADIPYYGIILRNRDYRAVGGTADRLSNKAGDVSCTHLVDNGLQDAGTVDIAAWIALAKGAHPIKVVFFQKTGGLNLELFYSGEAPEAQEVPPSVLFH